MADTAYGLGLTTNKFWFFNYSNTKYCTNKVCLKTL